MSKRFFNTLKYHSLPVYASLLCWCGSLLGQSYQPECLWDSSSFDYQQECCNDYSSGRFFLRGDLLVWKTHITGLELDFGSTSIATDATDPITIITTDEYDTDPTFDWNAGVRIAAGYDFDCSQWGVGATWTHFNSTGKRNFPEGNEGRIKLKFDQIDLFLAYNYYTNQCVKLKPYLGIRGAVTREHVDCVLLTDITATPPPSVATETRTFNDDQKFNGIGPLFGIAADWNWTCGLGFYGSVGGSILYGRYKLHYNDTDTLTEPARIILSTNRRSLHSFDPTIDLEIGIRWITTICNSEASLRLGLEHHEYFNNSRLGVSRGDLSLTGVTLAAGIAF